MPLPHGSMMRTTGLTVAAAAGLILVSTTPAAAATAEDTSEPNGRLTVLLRSGSTTDHDRDGNADTATKSDKLVASYQVLKNFVGEDDQQSVRINVSVDGPGTAYDSTSTETVALTDGDGTNGFAEVLKVKRDTPAGDYDVTVSASAIETASATATIVVTH